MIRLPLLHDQAAVFRQLNCNRKLSPVDFEPREPGQLIAKPHPRRPFTCSTFVSIRATCPDSCTFKRDADGNGRGCFADSGFTKRTSNKLNAAAKRLSSLDVIRQEAHAITSAFGGRTVPQDGARGGRDLRLHVGGDVRTDEEARVLAAAADRWLARRGGTVWTYTHSWRTVRRRSWGKISALASCETLADVSAARARGYAPALVVPRFLDTKAWPLGRLRAVPCPAELRDDVSCATCRLCLDRDLLSLGVVIVFAIHGPTVAAHRALEDAAGCSLERPPKRKYTERKEGAMKHDEDMSLTPPKQIGSDDRHKTRAQLRRSFTYGAMPRNRPAMVAASRPPSASADLRPDKRTMPAPEPAVCAPRAGGNVVLW